MNRGNQAVEKIGIHVPTVLSISRCFLECFYGYMALTDGDDMCRSSFPSERDSTTLWPIALAMAELESFLSDTPLESNGETLLSSNAAELMAIAIAHGLTEGRSDGAEITDRMDIFLK